VIPVVVGSLLPGNSLRSVRSRASTSATKFQRFAAYGVLAFLPVIHEQPPVVGVFALGLVAFGVLLELGQPFDGRDFEVGDMVADTFGVLIGIAAGLPLRQYVMRQMRRL
jgi:VanZ family protein